MTENDPLVGSVGSRSDARTVYNRGRVALPKQLARLLALGSALDEVAQTGCKLVGRARVGSNERIDELTSGALAQVERGSRVARELSAYVRSTA